MTELISTFHIEWFQFLAQLLNFSIALAILWFMIGRPLSKTLDERKELIEKGVENGIQSETILAQSKQEADAAREQARKDALGIIADASHKAASYTSDAEHRALLIEEKLVADAKEQAKHVFSSTLEGEKNFFAEKIVNTTKELIKKDISTTQDHELFIKSQLNN